MPRGAGILTGHCALRPALPSLACLDVWGPCPHSTEPPVILYPPCPVPERLGDLVPIPLGPCAPSLSPELLCLHGFIPIQLSSGSVSAGPRSRLSSSPGGGPSGSSLCVSRSVSFSRLHPCLVQTRHVLVECS